MIRKNQLFLAVVLAAFMVIWGCAENPSGPGNVVDPGSTDFTKFVVVGNSLTAGFQSGGLSARFQANSFGAQIADQIGVSAFEQPLVADRGTSGILTLTGFDATGNPIIAADTGATDNFTNIALARPYDNMGIPGAFLYDFTGATSSADSWQSLISGGASTNALFDAILRGLGSQFAQVRALNPTLMLFWFGNNDILGYATEGAGLNGSFAAIPGTSPYTPQSQAEATAFGFPAGWNFPDMYAAAMDSLATLGADVVVANIPYVTSIPYFTTVTAADLPDSVEVPGAGTFPVVFAETDIAYYTLQLSADLPGMLAQGIGIPAIGGPPIPGNYTVTATELGIITDLIDFYNGIIATESAASGFALADMNQLLADVAAVSGPAGDGYPIGGGYTVKSDFITGGIFSLDGVHPNSVGYAIAANGFIKTIVEDYGARIPEINPSSLIFDNP